MNGVTRATHIRPRTRRRLITVGVAAGALLVSSVVGLPIATARTAVPATVRGVHPATAATALRPAERGESCPDTEQTSTSDLNGDGQPDVAIGVGGAGAVDLRYPAPGPSFLLTGAVSPTHAGSMYVGLLDGDDCADLVVGNPGPSTRAGSVAIVLDPAGVAAGSFTSISAPTPHPGDQFGAAVAVSGDDLLVGAPGATVNGHAGAGIVYSYLLTIDGGARLMQTITEDSPGIPGAAGTGDGFGRVLAANLVGMPDRTVAGSARAGQVDALTIDPGSGRVTAATAYTQNSPAVIGAVAAGNRFGAAISDRDGFAVIGAPGQAVSGQAAAGVVQTFTTANGALKAATGYSEDTPGVPGGAEAGDQFGASVAVGVFSCELGVVLAVGAPGESIGTVAGDGSVTEITLHEESAGDCPNRVLYPGPLLGGGAVQVNAHVGAALGVRTGIPDFDEDYSDGLLVGAPGTTVRGHLDEGTVYGPGGPYTFSAYDRADSFYGSFLPTAG